MDCRDRLRRVFKSCLSTPFDQWVWEDFAFLTKLISNLYATLSFTLEFQECFSRLS